MAGIAHLPRHVRGGFRQSPRLGNGGRLQVWEDAGFRLFLRGLDPKGIHGFGPPLLVAEITVTPEPTNEHQGPPANRRI